MRDQKRARELVEAALSEESPGHAVGLARELELSTALTILILVEGETMTLGEAKAFVTSHPAWPEAAAWRDAIVEEFDNCDVDSEA